MKIFVVFLNDRVYAPDLYVLQGVVGKPTPTNEGLSEALIFTFLIYIDKKKGELYSGMKGKPNTTLFQDKYVKLSSEKQLQTVDITTFLQNAF